MSWNFASKFSVCYLGSRRAYGSIVHLLHAMIALVLTDLQRHLLRVGVWWWIVAQQLVGYKNVTRWTEIKKATQKVSRQRNWFLHRSNRPSEWQLASRSVVGSLLSLTFARTGDLSNKPTVAARRHWPCKSTVDENSLTGSHIESSWMEDLCLVKPILFAMFMVWTYFN